jgi:pyruvate/2-oxoacid:ferredoxin oxidoreductase beta subunit
MKGMCKVKRIMLDGNRAASEAMRLARLAVATHCWNLYESINGRDITITKRIKKAKPVKAYLTLQKRFRGVTEEGLAKIQAQVDADYADLERLAALAA